MPEAQSTQLNDLRNSSCTPDMDSPTDLDAVSYESAKDAENLCRTDRTMSVESLNTLLSKLPEISIPATLFNPLPLQCIAANALPKNVRAEIDGVIAQYTELKGSDEDVDNLTPALHRALGIEKVATSVSVNKPVGPVCKKIIWREIEEETSTGFGLNLCGGVRCNNCSSLHAIVTGVSACLYETELIVEGACVIEWEGQTLDGCTYEEVQRIMSSIDPGLNKIEISFKKCSENLIISRGGFDWLPSFAAVRLNKRRNAIFEDKDELDCKSTVSYDSPELSHIPSSPAHSLSRSQEHLDIPLFPESSLRSCTRSRSHSPSPSEAKKPLAVTIVKETAQGSMEVPSKPTLSNLQTIMNVLPKGMVQLCLGYNKEFEELKISLLQVKGQSNKEFSDPCEVFINTYLVPDYRDQGVRSIMSSQNCKDSSEFHNTSYVMAADKIPCVALRVILWDAHKPKHIMFRGEVLLSLSDQQFVNLASEPTWYTLCPEDPNLSKLPSPVYSKHKNSVDNLLQKLKQKAHSLTTVKPISSELRSTSMLSLQGPAEKRSMTLARKKRRKETRKTYSGSFTPQLVDSVLQPEAQLKSCLKETCRQQKLSSILKVLREDSVDTASSETKKHNKLIIDEHTDGNSLHIVHDAQSSSTLQRRPRNKSTANKMFAERMSLPGKTDKRNIKENGKSFLEELDELMGQRNFGLQPTSERRDKTPVFKKEQMHYKLVDSYQSEDEHDKAHRPSLCRTSKPSDFSRYSAEVSLHRIRVEDTDRKEQSKKKSCTLPNEHTSQRRPTTLLPAKGGLDKRPPKPPKTYRSKSMGHIEKLGSDEELFIVRSHHMTNSVPVESAYKTVGSVDDLDLIELMSHSSSYDGHSSLDFGNRFGSCDILGDRGECILERSSPVGEYREDAEEIQHKKGLTKTKWRSLEDILASKPRKSKEKKLKTNRKYSPCETEAHTHTFLRRKTVQESGASCNVKLEFEFNDLNPANPVLLVKLTDIALPSSKMLSSDLLLKCYVNHLSTGVCILKDKTLICLKNNPSSAPLGILQFRTDIANLALQIRLYGESKMFSRKVIGQVSVDLAVFDLSGGKTHSQWFLLSKQTRST